MDQRIMPQLNIDDENYISIWIWIWKNVHIYFNYNANAKIEMFDFIL